jgi:hypothetical protein
MPLDPRKKAQAAEEGSVGVSAVVRLRWERWNQSRAVSVWTTIVEDDVRMTTALVGTNQQNKHQMWYVVAITIEGDSSRGDSHYVWDGGANSYSITATRIFLIMIPNLLSFNKWSKKELLT